MTHGGTWSRKTSHRRMLDTDSNPRTRAHAERCSNARTDLHPESLSCRRRTTQRRRHGLHVEKKGDTWPCSFCRPYWGVLGSRYQPQRSGRATPALAQAAEGFFGTRESTHAALAMLCFSRAAAWRQLSAHRGTADRGRMGAAARQARAKTRLAGLSVVPWREGGRVWRSRAQDGIDKHFLCVGGG